MKSLDINKLNTKQHTIISSEKALKDVIPINWLINEDTHVYCTNCLNFKPVGSCKYDNDEECKICVCSLCCCDDPGDSKRFLERPLYIPKRKDE